MTMPEETTDLWNCGEVILPYNEAVELTRLRDHNAKLIAAAQAACESLGSKCETALYHKLKDAIDNK